MAVEARFGKVWSGMVGSGTVCFGMAGAVGQGKVVWGEVWLGMAVTVRSGLEW